MVSRLIGYLMWLILIGAVLIILWFFVEPIIWWTEYSEIRIYVRLFLLLIAISTFSSLRLYNAIVQNTRFAIKLREALGKFSIAIPALDRTMKNLNSSLGNTKSSLDALKKSLDRQTEEVIELTEKSKQKK